VADKPWFVFRAQEWVLHDDTDAQVYFWKTLLFAPWAIDRS
jgi:hypothetical protein